MLNLLQQHTQEKWVMMYAERWLKAGVEQEDGSITARTKGTPQGGVISPLFANIYLHHALDKWMDEAHPHNPFERYADDIVIHCRSKEEAEHLLKAVTKKDKAVVIVLFRAQIVFAIHNLCFVGMQFQFILLHSFP